MSLNNSSVDGLIKLLMQNVAFSNVGDAGGLQPSATAGVFYLSLHTSDPGGAGNQNTNECTYTSYARVPVARSTGGWTFASHAINPAATIAFPPCTGGSQTATFAGLGSDPTGGGNLFWSGAITPNIVISSGVTPELTTASTVDLT
jgi:hypothetical protein